MKPISNVLEHSCLATTLSAREINPLFSTPVQSPVTFEFASSDQDTLALRVLVAHEDLSTGVRAKEVLDRVAENMGIKSVFRLSFWRFDLLHDLMAQCEAMTHARQADVVFLSMHGNRPLSSTLCHWIKQWMVMRDERPCALVVSLDSGVQGSDKANSILDYLRKAAKAAGVDIFPHFGGAMSTASGFVDPVGARIRQSEAFAPRVVPRGASAPAWVAGVGK